MSRPERSDEQDSIARLLRLAGERSLPREPAMNEARVQAQAAWQSMLASQRLVHRRRAIRVFLYAAAAAGVAAAALVFTDFSRPAAPATVAQVQRVEGDAQALRDRFLFGDERIAVAGNMLLHTDAVLVTGQGRVAISLTGSSVRLAERTRLRLDRAGLVELEHGSVYVDAGVLPGPALRVLTPAGVVTHTGTQFQIDVDARGTGVRVREGSVRIEPGTLAPIEVAAGEAVRLSGSGQVLVRESVPTFGTQWEWVTAIAPAFGIENRSLGEFLAWMAREQGWRLRFEPETLEASASRTVLHGSIEGLTAEAALDRVSTITGLSFALEAGVLTVKETVQAEAREL